jgi:hypothetical protein
MMQRVFILGNPRSGTSLLRLMINSHPALIAPPESGFLHWWFNKYHSWNLQNSNSATDIEQFVADLMTSKKFETWNINKLGLIEFIKLNKPKNYAELGSLIYLFWGNARNKIASAIIDKNNYYIHHLRDLSNIWPDAKFIFLIRDGRDVACSYLDMQTLATQSPYKPKLPVNIEEIAREWSANNQNIYDFLEQRSKERWIMIRYEDLLVDTEMTLQKICLFLDVNYAEEMMLYYKTNDEPDSTLDWKKKTLESPDASNIGKYKNRLKAEEIEVFNNIANTMLNFAGYGK